MNVLALERLFNRIQQGSLARSATPATLFFSPLLNEGNVTGLTVSRTFQEVPCHGAEATRS
jgi:hypothetical protein